MCKNIVGVLERIKVIVMEKTIYFKMYFITRLTFFSLYVGAMDF